MFRPMDPEEKAYLERTAGVVHMEFIRAVANARRIPEEEVRKFADGRIILGSEAKEYNLVDGYGGVYEAARAVFDLLEKPLTVGEEPELYYPAGKFEDLRRFIESKLPLPNLFGANGIRLAYMMQ
jgi:protease-4